MGIVQGAGGRGRPGAEERGIRLASETAAEVGGYRAEGGGAAGEAGRLGWTQARNRWKHLITGKLEIHN